MLNIQIDNPELEKNIRQTYGDDSQLIANAFLEFIRQQGIKSRISEFQSNSLMQARA